MDAPQQEPAPPPGAPPQQNFFRDVVYKTGAPPPWDIGRAQPALQHVAHLFHGSVLDVGCGTGDNALFLGNAPRVSHVVAVDFSPEAIALSLSRLEAAHPKPHARVEFIEGDVFALPPEIRDFDVLLDSAVFHCIGDDDAQRRYLSAITKRIKVGGTAVMLVFSDRNKDPWVGPRRISERHARDLWTAHGWKVESINMDVSITDRINMASGVPRHALLMVATRVE